MAVNDAYSRYVMTLNPLSYLRLRDLSTNMRLMTDEVLCGPNLTAGQRVMYQNLAASGVGSGVFLPSAPAATFLKPEGVNSRVISHSGYNWDGSYGYLYSNQCPNVRDMTVNVWFRNTANHGAVNHRIFTMLSSEFANNQTLSLFSWNSTDNMLVEALFKRKKDILGTGTFANRGNNETYRYIAAQGSPTPINTLSMMTVTIDRENLKLYKNGVFQSGFTWSASNYGLIRPQTAVRWGGAYYPGDSNSYDYTRAEYGECSIHTRALNELEIADLYAIGMTGVPARTIVGQVTDILGAGLARLVRAHSMLTGAVLGETTSAGDGTFTMNVPSAHRTQMYLVAFDDLNIAPDFNAAITSNISPTA